MTSTALTLLLLVGVVTMLVGSRASYSKAQRLGEIEEEGRYAMDQILHDVRMAGFSGCSVTGTSQASTWYRPQLHWNFDSGTIRAYEANLRANWPSELLALVGSQLDPISDVLVTQVPIGNPITLRSSMSTKDAPLNVGSDAGLTAGDVVLMSDCVFRSYFEVTSIDRGRVFYRALHPAELSRAPVQSLGHAYTAGDELTVIETQMYFVRESSDGTRSLWRRAGARPAEEVGKGIEQMQLIFGVDSDGDDDIDEYVSADRVSQWQDVRSAQVELFVTADDVATSDEGGAKSFKAAVALRNGPRRMDR